MNGATAFATARRVLRQLRHDPRTVAMLILVPALLMLLLITALGALLGVALGLFMSAFARTEFQAAQFRPVVIFPQLLLCGLFHPRAEMATVLRWVSDAMPLSYSVDALKRAAVTSPAPTCATCS